MKKEDLCRLVAAWAARNYMKEDSGECPTLDRMADRVIYDLDSLVKSPKYRKIMRETIDEVFYGKFPELVDEPEPDEESDLTMKLFPHVHAGNMGRLVSFIYWHVRWADIATSNRAFVILSVLIEEGLALNSPRAFHLFVRFLRSLGVSDDLKGTSVHDYWKHNPPKLWGKPKAIGVPPRNAKIHLQLAEHVRECIAGAQGFEEKLKVS